MSRHRLVALTLVAGLAALAAADETSLGTGTYLASGSKVVSTISAQPGSAKGDEDQYMFDGYAGQTVSVAVLGAKVKPPGRSLLPFLEVYRPDGSLVGVADKAKILPKAGAVPTTKASFVFKLDQTGVWTVRVRGGYAARIVKGDNEGTPEVVEKSYLEYDYASGRTSGDYTISVKSSAAKPVILKNATAGADGTYRFLVPGAGGAQFGGVLTYKGGGPTFDALHDPRGSKVSVPGSYITTVPGKSLTIQPVPIPSKHPLGTYVVSFLSNPTTPATNVSFKSTLKVTSAEKPLKTKLAAAEPTILDVTPAEGGPNIQVVLTCENLLDPAGQGSVRVFLNRIEIDPTEINLTTQGNRSQVRFTTPPASELPDGSYDVRVVSTNGQSVTAAGGFTVVPPPEPLTIDPVFASPAGLFDVTITGNNFNPAEDGMEIGLQRGADTTTLFYPPVSFTEYSSTVLKFKMPSGSVISLVPGVYRVVVRDKRTQRTGMLFQTLELDDAAIINRVSPGLVPVLGGDIVYIKGSTFETTDKVYLETAPASGTYEEITASQTTYQNDTLHQFVAPPRVKGTYRVYVETTTGYQTPSRSFSYYQLSDFTSSLGLSGTDTGDGWTTFLADYDRDPALLGAVDLFVSRKGGSGATDTLASTPQTRVFRNNGSGSFEDVTASAMPPVTSDDDWRADRVWVTDVTMDGYPDLVLVTNSGKFPTPDAKSHVRILVNERRSSQLPVTERAFRDKSADLMAPMRTMSVLYGGGGGANQKDDWRGLDMFVGDIDAANQGPPEIVITGDQVFENYYVSCNPYCASPYSGGYTYSFYWGGTRVFKWDPAARSGLGRYKFDANYFPRRSGITVPIFNPPPGVTIPTCAPGECRGRFTPFIGQRLAVGAIDEDGKVDFAVAHNGVVQKDGSRISSLQVAINRVSTTDGSNITDLTDDLTAFTTGTDFLAADTVAIGQPGYKGLGTGVIAIAKADPTGLTSSALRLFQFKDSVLEDDPGDFENITTQVLPATTANDRFHSSAISFLDVDADGDTDMVSLARTPPGGNGPAFRIFRNETAPAPNYMIFRESLKGLVQQIPTLASRGYFDGDALVIGDLDRDGASEFVITRATTAGQAGPHTRSITIDK